jgi:Holliday junction resolvasome RuvABC DNA-binding subunit
MVSMMNARPAKYPGCCTACGSRFDAGTVVGFEGKTVAGCPACTPELAEEAAKPPLELRVKIQFVKFSKPDGSFVVAEALWVEGNIDDTPAADGVPFTVVGSLGRVEPGDLLDTRGRFQRNEKYKNNWEFKTTTAVHVFAATDEALKVFLSKFPNVGPKRAEQILQALGGKDAVLQALENDPDRLTVVDGITPERARGIQKAFKEKSALNDARLFLAELGVGPALEAQLLEEYGEDVIAVLSEDPYQLMDLRGVGFPTADKIAAKVSEIEQRAGRPGIAKDDPRRLAAAVLSMFEKVEEQGHTWATIRDICYL